MTDYSEYYNIQLRDKTIIFNEDDRYTIRSKLSKFENGEKAVNKILAYPIFRQDRIILTPHAYGRSTAEFMNMSVSRNGDGAFLVIPNFQSSLYDWVINHRAIMVVPRNRPSEYTVCCVHLEVAKSIISKYNIIDIDDPYNKEITSDDTLVRYISNEYNLTCYMSSRFMLGDNIDLGAFSYYTFLRPTVGSIVGLTKLYKQKPSLLETAKTRELAPDKTALHRYTIFNDEAWDTLTNKTNRQSNNAKPTKSEAQNTYENWVLAKPKVTLGKEYGNNAKNTFDWIDVEFSISSYSKTGNLRSEQREAVRIMLPEVKAEAVKAIQEQKRFQATGVPVNMLRLTELILTKDSRIILKFELKDIKNG